MDEAALGLLLDALRLAADPLALALALALATLARSRLLFVLVVVDLGLFMEIAATQLAPAYRFGELLLPRLLASALQVGAGCLLLSLWRRRHGRSESVAAH